MRRIFLVALVVIVAVVGFSRLDSITTSLSTTAATTFTEGFTGAPSTPQNFTTSSRWDVAVHARDDRTGLPAMQAHHGGDCGAFPATHVSDSHASAVFQCRDHLMTALRGDGYGMIYVTPNHMADWSQGEAVIRWDVSSFRSSGRDWWDVWITPYEDNVQLPLLDWLPDAQGPPRRSLQIWHQLQEPTLCATLYDNGRDTNLLNRDNTGCINRWYTENPAWPGVSATRRDTYEIRLTRTHLKVWMPAYNHVFIDKALDQPLNFTRGVVQFGHHSYSPEKAQITDYPYNTWHWDNVTIDPAIPFSIIKADRRYVDGSTTNVVNFSAAAPANSHLRFSAWSVTDVSFDGGQTWQAAQRVNQVLRDESHLYNYWHPMPAGARSVMLRSTAKQLGVIDWHAKDFSIWSLFDGPVPTIPLPPTVAPPPGITATVPVVPPPPPNVPIKVVSSAVIQPTNPLPGQTVSMTLSVTLDQTTTAAVVADVTDAAGNKIGQQVWDNQAFTANVRRDFTLSNQVPAIAPLGTKLVVAVGVYTAGRAALLSWNAGAATLTVGGAATATPRPTQTPAPKPTQTPAPKPTETPAPKPTQTVAPPSPQPTKFSSGIRFTPNPVQVGKTVTAQVSVVSPITTTAVVTFEVYDSSGRRLLAKDFTNVALTANTKLAMSQQLPIPSTTPVGTYKVKIGVFNADKSQRLHWNDSAGSLTIVR